MNQIICFDLEGVMETSNLQPSRPMLWVGWGPTAQDGHLGWGDGSLMGESDDL